MKRKHMILGCVAAALIASATIAPAMAFFTDHTQAAGSVQITIGDEPTIEEPKVDEAEKQIVIKNNEGQPVYVRVGVFAAGTAPTVSGTNWTSLTDGYYYFTKPIAAQEATDTLTVQVKEYLEQYVDEKDSVKNIIVVYESTPVLYDEAGDPVPYNDSSIVWEDNVTVIE